MATAPLPHITTTITIIIDGDAVSCSNAVSCWYLSRPRESQFVAACDTQFNRADALAAIWPGGRTPRPALSKTTGASRQRLLRQALLRANGATTLNRYCVLA